MLRFILSFSVFLLVACGPVYDVHYTYQSPPTPQGRICANNCLDKMQACKSTCRAQIADCQRIASLEADNAYLQYVNERQAQGKEIKKSRHDFRFFDHCAENCEEQCEQTHRICHVNCGGNVVEHRQCTAFCE